MCSQNVRQNARQNISLLLDEQNKQGFVQGSNFGRTFLRPPPKILDRQFGGPEKGHKSVSKIPPPKFWIHQPGILHTRFFVLPKILDHQFGGPQKGDTKVYPKSRPLNFGYTSRGFCIHVFCRSSHSSGTELGTVISVRIRLDRTPRTPGGQQIYTFTWGPAARRPRTLGGQQICTFM